MVFESLAIIGIVLAMAFLFLRVKKREYCIAMLPLLIQPILQILSIPAIRIIGSFSAVRPITISFCITFMALISESILIGLAASMLKSRKQKTSYLIICGVFALVLAMIFMLSAMKTMVA